MVLKEAKSHLSIFYELGEFLVSRKKWYLIPVVIILVLLSFLIILAQSSPMGPFIYTLF